MLSFTNRILPGGEHSARVVPHFFYIYFMGGRCLFENLSGNIYIQNIIFITKNATKIRLIIRQPEYRGDCISLPFLYIQKTGV